LRAQGRSDAKGASWTANDDASIIRFRSHERVSVTRSRREWSGRRSRASCPPLAAATFVAGRVRRPIVRPNIRAAIGACNDMVGGERIAGPARQPTQPTDVLLRQRECPCLPVCRPARRPRVSNTARNTGRHKRRAARSSAMLEDAIGRVHGVTSRSRASAVAYCSRWVRGREPCSQRWIAVQLTPSADASSRCETPAATRILRRSAASGSRRLDLTRSSSSSRPTAP